MENNMNIKKAIAISLSLMITASLFGCSSKEVESVDGTIISDNTDFSSINEESVVDSNNETDTQPVSSEISVTMTSNTSFDLTEESSTDETQSETTNSTKLSVDETTCPESEEKTDTEATTVTSAETTEEVPETYEESTDYYSDDNDDYLDEYDDELNESDDSLSSTQKNAINMLNYMSVLTQEINDTKDNRVYLESAYSSLINNTYPNAVDSNTKSKINYLLDTLEDYRMISVKRERLEYNYEQDKAQAIREAIPNPVALLSAVQSGSKLKMVASVLYMSVDAASKYSTASRNAEMQYLQSGWELDDEEAKQLHNSRKGLFTYMVDMVNNYGLSGDYALNEESVQKFVEWKSNDNLVRKISWFESNQQTYKQFGLYWLELAKDYFDYGKYEKCLEAIEQYESVNSRIFRKDFDYAKTLPLAIISAKEVLNTDEYIELANKYADIIIANSNETDWVLRYFVAQIDLDLYNLTTDSTYLEKAYNIAYNNMNILVDEQRILNSDYLADTNTVTIDKIDKNSSAAQKKAYKRQKEEAENYNKMLKERRKVELPPVSEPLYLNCDLLFALADELNISSDEKSKIDSILHENGESIFLTKALDDRFWFNNNGSGIDVDSLNIDFDGEKISIPANCVTDRSTISVSVSGTNEEITLTDWEISKVKRPKNSSISDFVATFTSKGAKDYKYKASQTVTIKITPVSESPENTIEIEYDVVPKKILFVINGIEFERKK